MELAFKVEAATSCVTQLLRISLRISQPKTHCAYVPPTVNGLSVLAMRLWLCAAYGSNSHLIGPAMTPDGEVCQPASSH